MIYLAGVYFYSIWITINCDSWSKKLFDIYDLEQRGDFAMKKKLKSQKILQKQGYPS